MHAPGDDVDHRAWQLTSVDGIRDWKLRGLAFDPLRTSVRSDDAHVNHWHKMERPGVYIENGHVAAVTLAVLDLPKEDSHGSKVIVIPFDDEALDRDLQRDSN